MKIKQFFIVTKIKKFTYDKFSLFFACLAQFFLVKIKHTVPLRPNGGQPAQNKSSAVSVCRIQIQMKAATIRLPPCPRRAVQGTRIAFFSLR
ncbi:MAG: hypothetical protein ED859_02370 [Desulfuromonadales bacterium]|nr:MAG: hypothetical protein ED859_02370 [Desulfuromonadales bacterium]